MSFWSSPLDLFFFQFSLSYKIVPPFLKLWKQNTLKPPLTFFPHPLLSTPPSCPINAALLIALKYVHFPPFPLKRPLCKVSHCHFLPDLVWQSTPWPLTSTLVSYSKFQPWSFQSTLQLISLSALKNFNYSPGLKKRPNGRRC